MACTVDDITRFFAAYGWDYERPEHTVFRTSFMGETGSYDIWIHLTEAWVYFTISPYLRQPEEEGPGLATLHCLLRANAELSMAKFAVDEDGDVVLTVELPLEGFCYSHFADALTALSRYADEHRRRLDAAMATDAAAELV